MSNVTFVGGGSFGTALAVLLADKGNKVTMYCRNDKTVDEINSYHTNKKYEWQSKKFFDINDFLSQWMTCPAQKQYNNSRNTIRTGPFARDCQTKINSH